MADFTRITDQATAVAGQPHAPLTYDALASMGFGPSPSRVNGTIGADKDLASSSRSAADSHFATGADVESRAPVLPDVTDVGAPNHTTRDALVPWLEPNGFFQAEVFNLLVDLAAGQMILYSKLRRAHHLSQLNYQVMSAAATRSQVKGERRSSGIKLTGAIVGVAVAGCLGFKGQQLSYAPQSRREAHLGGMITAIGTASSQAVNAMTDFIDKTSGAGGMHAADEARMRKAVLDIYASLYKGQEDSWNTAYDLAKRNLQNVFDLNRKYWDQLDESIRGINSNVAV